MADEEESYDTSSEKNGNDAFYRGLANRKLKDQDKTLFISELEKHPALWKNSQNFARDEKTRAVEELCVKFSLTDESVKRFIHSLRTSLIREIRREKEDKEYQSCWKFFKRLAFMKEDVIQCIHQESVKEWGDEEVNILIDYYHSNPVLWDHQCQEYRDRNLRSIAMEKIRSLLKKRTDEEIKNQWHNLKTIFQREEKRQEGSKVSGTGTAEVYTSKWKFFESLSFLKSCSEVDESKSTMETNAPVNKKRKSSNKMNANKDLDEVKVELYKSCIEVLSKPSTSTACEKQETMSEDQTFGKTVSDTLARFTGRQKATAKKLISDVLFEVEMGQDLSSLSYPVHPPVSGLVQQYLHSPAQYSQQQNFAHSFSPI